MNEAMNTNDVIEIIERYHDAYINEMSPQHITLLTTLLELARDIADNLEWSLHNEARLPVPPQEPGAPAAAPAGKPPASAWNPEPAIEQVEDLFLHTDLTDKDMNSLVSYRTRFTSIIQAIDDTIDEVGYYI